MALADISVRCKTTRKISKESFPATWVFWRGDRSYVGLGALQQENKAQKPHERLSNKILRKCNKSRSTEIILSAQSPSKSKTNIYIHIYSFIRVKTKDNLAIIHAV